MANFMLYILSHTQKNIQMGEKEELVYFAIMYSFYIVSSIFFGT